METFQSPYLPTAVKEPELKPTFKQILGSSFNMENDLVNFYDYITTPAFKPDPTFNFMDTFKSSKLPLNFGQYLAPANSQAEYDMLLAKTQKEFKDRAVTAAGGWTATLTQLAAGMVSPTVFLPFAGQARGGMAFAEVLGLAAAGSAAQESAMYFNQTTRTEAELYSGIAFGTLMGGFLGGAWLGLSKEGKARLQSDMTRNQGKINIPGNKPDMPGFEETSVRVDQPTTAEVKADIREMGIRNPTDIKEMLDDADDADISVPIRDRVIVPDEITVRATSDGASFLETKITENVNARFVKNADDAEESYRIQLYDDAGKELPMTAKAADALTLRDTGVSTEAGLRQAYQGGALDDQMYKLLESVDEPGMVPNAKSEAISDTGLSVRDTEGVGAQVSRPRNTLGFKKAPNKLRQAAMNALGMVNPVYRMAQQPFFPSLRDAIMKLDMAGLRQDGLELRESSPDGGEAMWRTKAYDYYVFELTRKMDEAFVTYFTGGNPKLFDSAMIVQLKSVYGPQIEGKMNWPQFKEAIFDGLNTGEFDKEMAPAVAAFKQFFAEYNNRHKQYMKEFADRGMDVEPLYKELMEGEFGEGILNYAHHIPDQEKIMNNIPEFLNDFGTYNEGKLGEDFDRALPMYKKKKARLELEQAYNDLTPGQLTERLDEVESDLEFLEEIPAWSDFRQQRLDLNRQAKDEGWSKEQLKAEQKALQEGASDELKGLQAERKELMSRAKTMRKLGGDSNKLMTKLKADLEKADNLISDMLRTTLPQLQKADLTIAKFQKDGDKVMKKASSDVRKVVEALAKRHAQMSKLLQSTRGNSTSRAKVQAHLDTLGAKHESMLERLSIADNIQGTIDSRLSELNLLREDAVREATTLVRSRAAKANDLEDKLEAAAGKIVTPEDKLRIRDQIGQELVDHETNFELKWRAKGNQADNILTDKADFKEQSIKLATLLQQRLTHSEIELSPAWLSLRKDARGPELLRVWKIPYAIKNKWIIKDIEMIARSFDRSMAPDLELWRTFNGKPSGTPLLGEMQEELTEHLMRVNTAKYVKLPKGWIDNSAGFLERAAKRITAFGESDDLFVGPKNFSNEPGEGFQEMTEPLRTQIAKTFIAAGEEYTKSFDIAIQRIRGIRGRPLDSRNPWWRAGKSIKELNVVTMMGGVVTSSLSDASRPLAKYSLPRVYRTSWAPMVKSFSAQDGKAYRIQSREINARIISNIEPLLGNRAQAVFDTTDETMGRSRVERGITMTTQKMGLVAGFAQWTALMKTLAGNVTHATMAEYIPNVAKNWGTPAAEAGDLLEMRTYLRNLGLTDSNILRIAEQMNKPGGMETFSNGGTLPNLGAWDDPSAYQAYQAAAISDVSSMIVTPGLERPEIVDQNMLTSLVFQFKGFTFASNSRVTMSGLQGNDPYLIQGIAFSLAFGALSYYTYALSTGGKTKEKAMEGNPDEWMWEAFKRSGLMGAMGLPFDVASRVPALTGKETSTAFATGSDLLGSLFGPTYGQVNKLATAVAKMTANDPNQSPEAAAKQQAKTIKTLRQVFVPYQNVFYLRQLLDRASEAMFGS